MANARVHATTRRVVHEAFAEEKPSLLPLPLVPYRSASKLERRVSHEGMVSVYFATLADIVSILAKAEREGLLREKIRFFCRASLLIVDEIGYLPVIPGGGDLFFQLVDARYECGAMILTSNRGFAEWGDVFGDPVVATALLGRLLHHAGVIKTEGSSYRLREHADLLPEHIRSKSLITPPHAVTPMRRRGRPPKNHGDQQTAS